VKKNSDIQKLYCSVLKVVVEYACQLKSPSFTKWILNFWESFWALEADERNAKLYYHFMFQLHVT